LLRQSQLLEVNFYYLAIHENQNVSYLEYQSKFNEVRAEAVQGSLEWSKMVNVPPGLYNYCDVNYLSWSHTVSQSRPFILTHAEGTLFRTPLTHVKKGYGSQDYIILIHTLTYIYKGYFIKACRAT